MMATPPVERLRLNSYDKTTSYITVLCTDQSSFFPYLIQTFVQCTVLYILFVSST